MLLDDPVVPPSEPPEDQDGRDDDGNGDGRPARWVTVATFDTSAAAHIARLRLEFEDIDCFIADENIVSLAWHYSIATGGIKLQVPAPQVERAAALLAGRVELNDEPQLDDADRCPRCGSQWITRDGFTLRRIIGMGFLSATACSLHWVLGGLLLSACVIAIVRASGFRCEDCDHPWDARRGFAIVPTARVARGQALNERSPARPS